MDKKYNTNDDANVEMKKALSKSAPKRHPLMSEAERRLKFKEKE